MPLSGIELGAFVQSAFRTTAVSAVSRHLINGPVAILDAIDRDKEPIDSTLRSNLIPSHYILPGSRRPVGFRLDIDECLG